MNFTFVDIKHFFNSTILKPNDKTPYLTNLLLDGNKYVSVGKIPFNIDNTCLFDNFICSNQQIILEDSTFKNEELYILGFAEYSNMADYLSLVLKNGKIIKKKFYFFSMYLLNSDSLGIDDDMKEVNVSFHSFKSNKGIPLTLSLNSLNIGTNISKIIFPNNFDFHILGLTIIGK